MRRTRVLLALLALASASGALFSAVSTYDFVAHLDRQTHGLHCSFIPGLGATDVRGTSGCAVTLMSPYSSVLRTWVWGGIPVSLPSLSVFAFLVFTVVLLIARRAPNEPRATGLLAVAWLVPALTSAVMGTLSFVTLGAACKLCIGVYASSAVGLIAASALWLDARRLAKGRPAVRVPRSSLGADDTVLAADQTVRDASDTIPDAPVELRAEDRRVPPTPWSLAGGAVGMALVFVALPVITYAAMAPDHGRYVGQCGSLTQPEAPDGVLIALEPHPTAIPAVEVLDPLCPSCRAFEARLGASGLAERIDRRALLFPLDARCNWMVGHETVHAGACTISEAVLCAGDDAPDVLAWAFAEQERIRTQSEGDPAAAERLVTARFPGLARCVGSAEVRARLNRGLRWAVQNQLVVTTPQLFVGGKKLCDADIDLGLDFALARMTDGAR